MDIKEFNFIPPHRYIISNSKGSLTRGGKLLIFNFEEEAISFLNAHRNEIGDCIVIRYNKLMY